MVDVSRRDAFVDDGGHEQGNDHLQNDLPQHKDRGEDGDPLKLLDLGQNGF